MKKSGILTIFFLFIFMVLAEGKEGKIIFLNAVVKYTNKIIQTGQTKCYSKTNPSKSVSCKSFEALHDDGWYATIKHIGIPRNYTRNDSKEVVTDNNTGLMWQDNSDVQDLKKNWKEAKDYCENLNLGGYSDWRLPTITELEGIVNYGKVYPAIDDVFQNVNHHSYWSISGTNIWYLHWYLNYNIGNTFIYEENHKLHVRCVRNIK